MYSNAADFIQIGSLSFFGGVVAERVNTTKTRRKVNPISSWSVASSRIKMVETVSWYVIMQT